MNLYMCLHDSLAHIKVTRCEIKYLIFYFLSIIFIFTYIKNIQMIDIHFLPYYLFFISLPILQNSLVWNCFYFLVSEIIGGCNVKKKKKKEGRPSKDVLIVKLVIKG